MRRVFIALTLTLCGCWNFDQEFRNRCDGGFTTNLQACEAPAADGGGAAPRVTRLIDVTGPKCIGVASWCWESPSPGVGNDLFAISGTADDDVYVAGAGPTLLRFDGTRFRDLSALLPPSTLGPWEDPPVIHGMVNDSDGVWLIGERIGLMVSDGGFFTRVDAGFRGGDWTAIASHGGFRYLARGSLLVVPTNDGGVAGKNIPVLDGGAIRSLFVDQQACIATTSGADPVTGQVVDCRGERGVLIDRRADGGTEAFTAAFRLGDGGLAVGGLHGNLYEGGDGTAWRERRLPQFDTDDAILAASATPAGTLVTGTSGYIVNADTGEVVKQTYGSWLEAAWTSPSGTFWAAGLAGAVLRSDRVVTTDQPTAIRGAFVSDTRQVAVSQTGIFDRNGGGEWVLQQPDTNQNWLAVTALGNTLWLIDRQGQVFKRVAGADPVIVAAAGSYTDGGVFSTAIDGVSSAPPNPNALHIAAALTTRDGGVLLASGHRVFRVPEGSTEADFSPGTQIVGLAETLIDVVVATTDSLRQTEPNTGPIGIALNNRTIEAIAACPSGDIVVVGTGGLLLVVGMSNQSPPLSSVNFTGVWCAPDNTIWALTTSGFVVHRTDAGYLRENTSWGHEATSSINATFIGGNSTRLFIMGDNGAILARPLP